MSDVNTNVNDVGGARPGSIYLMSNTIGQVLDLIAGLVMFCC